MGDPIDAAAELRQRSGDIRRQRHRSNLAGLRGRQMAGVVAGANTNRAAGEVDVAPSQREQFAHSRARERRRQE